MWPLNNISRLWSRLCCRDSKTYNYACLHDSRSLKCCFHQRVDLPGLKTDQARPTSLSASTMSRGCPICSLEHCIRVYWHLDTLVWRSDAPPKEFSMPQTKEMSFSTKVIKMTRSTTYRDNQWWTEGENGALQSASRPPGQADFASLNSSQAI
jgi:hypothetical protein